MKADMENDLDGLFREGLKKPGRDIDFREGDWDAMEALLNDAGKKPFGITGFWGITGSIAAMLLLTAGWFFIQSDNNKKHTMAVSAPAKLIENKIDKEAAPVNKLAHQITAVKPTAASGGVNAGDAISVTANISVRHKTAVPVLQRTDHALYSVRGHKYSKNDKSAVSQSLSSQDIATAGTTKYAGTALSEAISAARIPLLNISETNNALITANEPANYLTAKGPANIYTKPVKPEMSNRSVFAVTVVASPDINGVNSFSRSKVGTNVGLLFSLGVSKRFSVRTGAVYSKKLYITNYSDYPAGTYKFKMDPETVTADCRVLDIPVNIDYLVYNKTNNKFSVGTGLSSYIMLRENYHYNFAWTQSYIPADYTIANQNQHFLGVLNLNASYYRRLGNKLSVGVEPYLKVPLTNIGYSKVKLQSTGVAIGVSWNINSPR